MGLGVLFLAVLIGVGLAALGGLAATASYIDDLPRLDSLEPVDLGENSAIYAADGSRINIIPRDRNRQAVAWSKISPFVRNATVAIEDRRYWQHEGVDYEGIARAAWKDLNEGSLAQGGSTITQQVVRNLYIPAEATKKSFERKIDEAWLALQLEREWSKRQILTTYLNIVFYGNNAYGVEAASQTYFSKHASELTLAQGAMIAGLPQAPSAYDPFSQPLKARQRRNQVLRAMRDAKQISPARYRSAARASLGLDPGRIYRYIRQKPFSDFVRERLEAHLKDTAPNAITSGGLRIETTLDPRLQFAAKRAIKSILTDPDDPAAVIVSIDPRTGYIRAMQSSAPAGLEFNVATQGPRQPGSTFKPIALAAAVDMGVDPNTTYYRSVGEIHIPISGAETWEVSTFDHYGRGTMSLASALMASDNSVFAQLSADIGAPAEVRMARRLGVTRTHLREDVLSTALGGQEVTPLEMASVYATFAANGVYRVPEPIRRVTTASGRPVGDFAPKARRAITDGVANQITRILSENMVSGLGTTARTTDKRPQAGKTGTTNDSTDAWFCGYTPRLATCVWMGYVRRAIPMRNIHGIAEVSGPTLPSQIWHAYMDVALAGVPPVPFADPKVPFVAKKDIDLPFSRGERAIITPYVPPANPTPTETETTPTDTGKTSTTGDTTTSPTDAVTPPAGTTATSTPTTPADTTGSEADTSSTPPDDSTGNGPAVPPVVPQGKTAVDQG